MLDLNAFAKEAHALSREKGWYEDRDLTDNDVRLSMEELIHSELSEATEDIRIGDLGLMFWDELTATRSKLPVSEDGRLLKPVGLPSEIADVVIRTLDYKQAFGLPDFEQFTFSVDPELAGKNPIRMAAAICRMRSRISDYHPLWPQALCEECYSFTQSVDINLDDAILKKHAFNKTRPHRHGNKAL